MLSHVQFETDSKLLEDSINSSISDYSDLGAFILLCKILLAQNPHFRVRLVKMQANTVAQLLAKAALCYASPKIFHITPSCIYNSIFNEWNSMILLWQKKRTTHNLLESSWRRQWAIAGPQNPVNKTKTDISPKVGLVIGKWWRVKGGERKRSVGFESSKLTFLTKSMN